MLSYAIKSLTTYTPSFSAVYYTSQKLAFVCSCGGHDIFTPVCLYSEAVKTILAQYKEKRTYIENLSASPYTEELLMDIERKQTDFLNTNMSAMHTSLSPHVDGCKCAKHLNYDLDELGYMAMHHFKKYVQKAYPRNKVLRLYRHFDLTMDADGLQIKVADKLVKDGQFYEELQLQLHYDGRTINVKQRTPKSKKLRDTFTTLSNKHFIENFHTTNLEDIRTLDVSAIDLFLHKQLQKQHSLREIISFILDYLHKLYHYPALEQYRNAELFSYANTKLERRKNTPLQSIKKELPFSRPVLHFLRENGLNNEWTLPYPFFSYLESLQQIAQHDPTISLEFVQQTFTYDDFYENVDLDHVFRLITLYGYRIHELNAYMLRAWASQGLSPKMVIHNLYHVCHMKRILMADIPKFPSSLIKTHDLLKRDYVYIQDSHLADLYSALLPELNATYSYQNELYSIVIPQSLEDIVEEGKKLNHCVASYAEKVATKESIVLFLRKNDELDSPYYTLEVRNGRLRQTQTIGKRTTLSPHLIPFIEEWKKAKKIL